MKPEFSDIAKDLLTKLLTINPQQRLGASKKDSEELKAHPFFAPVDWKAVQEKKTHPPFKPIIENPSDTTNFAKEFTKEPVNEASLAEAPENKDNKYENFSYYPSLAALINKDVDMP